MKPYPPHVTLKCVIARRDQDDTSESLTSVFQPNRRPGVLWLAAEHYYTGKLTGNPTKFLVYFCKKNKWQNHLEMQVLFLFFPCCFAANVFPRKITANCSKFK
jgi:hypothetical protein